MKLGMGRVLKAEALTSASRFVPELQEKTLPRGQLVRREVLEAADRVRGLLAAAEERAARIVHDAEQAAAELRLRAEAEGRADAAAQIAAHALALRDYEVRKDERALDRTVELARVLAERLLGESLRVAPTQVAALAKQALSEARGARRITLVAHPEDARILEHSLPLLGLSEGAARVVADDRRSRGNLRVETDLGVLDADIAPQLERLSLKLRESLTDE